MATRYVIASAGGGISEGPLVTQYLDAGYRFVATLTGTNEATFTVGHIPGGSVTGSVLEVLYVPEASLTSNDTNYATITVTAYDDGGNTLGTVASVTTKTSGSGGSGNWTTQVPVTLTLGAGATAIVKNASFVVAVTKAAAGVTFPMGFLSITYDIVPYSAA